MGYYGKLTKKNSSYTTSSFFSKIPEKPGDLDGLGGYSELRLVDNPKYSVPSWESVSSFSIVIDKNSTVIILP